MPRLDDPQLINVVAGGIAGAATAVFVCPLDVLKTRMQVQTVALGDKRPGIRGGLKHILHAEGLPGLYRGLSPTLLALLPNWAVYFTVYERMKEWTAQRTHDGKSTTGSYIASASVAGLATQIVTNPLWVAKTRLQTQHMQLHWRRQHGPLYTGAFNTLYRMAREEGLHGLYSGLGPTMLGVAHVAIQFPLYEYLKQKLAERRHGGTPDDLNPGELICASAASKMVASTATYPHEVIRSYMHIQGTGAFSGLGSTCRKIWHQDGIRGFYRGCSANLLRTTPAAALTFTSFELISKKLRATAARHREEDAARQS